MQIPLYKGNGKGRSRALNSQQLVNLIPIIDPSGKAPAALYGTPGLTELVTCGAGPIRGLLQLDGVGYVVSGSEFYTVTSSYVATKRGDLTTSAGPVTLVSNGLEVMVADGGGYVYDIATQAFGQITDPDFPGAATVAYLDGYGLFNPPGTQQFYATDLQNFTSIDALQFASSESSPDDLIRVFTDHGEVWLFGSESTEVWQNTGIAGFPFERIGNTRLERGCAAAFSPAKVDNSVFWLGDDLIVYRADGYLPQRISDEQVEYALGQMANPSDAEGWTYDQEGHKYYVLQFPTDNQTWVYDVATQVWHSRRTEVVGRWRAAWSMYLGGKVIVGDSQSGKLLWLNLDEHSDLGDEIISVAVLPSVSGEGYVEHASLEIEMQAGVGLNSGQGSNPKIMIDWSDDQGATWSNRLEAEIGRIGQYGVRAQIRRLGQSLDRRYRVYISDPVRRYIVAAYLNGRGG